MGPDPTGAVNGLPPLPDGFVMQGDQSAPTSTPPLPDGFQLEGDQSSAPPLPPGFQLQQQQPPIQDPSALGAAARGAIRQAVPTTGAVVGGSLAADTLAGTELGARAGLPGAIAGGVAGALGGGYLASKGEDWVLDKLGLRNASGTLTSAFNPAQEQADVSQHPYASEAGGLLDTLLSLGTGNIQALNQIGGAGGKILRTALGANAPAASAGTRAVSAAIMGAGEAGNEAYNDGSVDPGKVLLAAGAGAAAPVARDWVSGLGGRVASTAAGLKGTGTGEVPNAIATEPGTAGRPDLQGQEAEGAGKSDIEVANDLTTTAPGIAAENAPAPEISGAGNPVGAPMVARTAARPSDPGRDYGKGSPAQAKGIETTPSQPNISVGDTDPTVTAALTSAAPPAATAEPPTPPINTGLGATDESIPAFLQRNPDGSFKQPPPAAPAQPVAQTPARATRNAAIQQEMQPQQAVPQLHPKIAEIVETPFVQAATEHAMTRPIETRPMPSGANSSKDINGPVYVDPSIPEQFQRPLAVHETVEQLLMANGMKYPDAHTVATAAEHAAVVRAGLDWGEYTKTIDGYLANTEREHPTDLPTDLHVNPEAADNDQMTHHMGKDEILQRLTAPPQEVTAPVTKPGRVPKIVQKALQFAADNNMSRVAQRLQAAPPDQQIAIARQLDQIARSKEFTEGRRPTVNGMVANTPALATKRQGALDAIQKAVAAHPNENPDFIPTSVPDKQALVGRLQKMVDAATAANGGQDPLTAYKPRVKPPEWQMLKAAQRAITKPTPKNITDYIAAEKMLKAGGAADVQATTRIDADIAKKGFVPEGENEAQNIERETFDPIEPVAPGKDNSYVEAQNDLRSWLNELPNKDYSTLAENYDLHNELTEPADPAQLMDDMKATLAAGQRGRVEPHETPGVPKQIAGAPLGESEGAASAGTVRAPTAEEQAKYGGKLTPEQLAAYKAKKAAPKTAPGTLQGVQDAAAKFLGDNSGAVRNLLPYIFPKSRNPIADRVAEDLSHEFNVNEGTMRTMDGKLGANFAAGHPQLSDAEWTKVYRDMETQTPLGPKEQAVYDQYVKPLVDERQRLYNLAKKMGFKLPDEYNGNVANIPRARVPDAQPRDNDTPWSRNLSSWDGALQDRVFFALDDNAGQRLIFSMDENGNPVIIRNGAPTVLKSAPASFEGKLGDTIPLNVGGKKGTFTVDEATAHEITNATNGEVKFAEHPLIAYANSIRGMRAAIMRDNLLKRIQANTTVQGFSTTDAEKARTLGYKETQLEQLQKAPRSGKTVYYDPRLQQLFDDFRRPGVNEDALESLRNFAQNMAKPLYLLSPTFHVMNIAAQHFIGTAAMLAREPAKAGNVFRNFIPDLASAYKSVLSQDALQQEMRAAGGRPMYASQVFDHGVIQDMMKSAGIRISQRPGLWSKFAQASGIPIDQWGHSLMRASNKVMWAGNDILLTSLYQTAKRLGMSPQEAAAAAHNYIGAYRPDSPTFMGARWAQKILNDPAFSWFGPYHQDLWQSIGRTAKNIATPENPADWREAVGATAALGLLTYGIYPYILDPFAKMITGNQNATLGRRGAAALAQIPGELYEGEPNAYTQAGMNLFTPSIPLNTIWEATHNLDWKGQHVLTPGAPAVTQAAQGVDYAARALVPPYAQAAALARQQGVTVGAVLKKMLESGVGLKEPSDAAARYEAQQGKHNEAELRHREKAPEGFFEKVFNR